MAIVSTISAKKISVLLARSEDQKCTVLNAYGLRGTASMLNTSKSAEKFTYGAAKTSQTQ